MRYLLLLCLLPTLVLSQENQLEANLANIAWIAGTWHGEAFGGQIEEIWSEPSGGSMMATFKLVVEGQVGFYEIEVIREVGNTLLLQLKHFKANLKGWETKDETVDFPLKYITKDKAVFEGMIFERIGESKMNVYVDVKNDNGEIEELKFEYTRQ